MIALLVAYYVLSDRYTPFTTDAYVQAYVVQVGPRFQGLSNLSGGEVIQVNVQENQSVEKGQLLFEIDPRPFKHRVAVLEARQVQASYQVAQMESELVAASAEEIRLVAEEGVRATGPRAGAGDLQAGRHDGAAIQGRRAKI